MINTSMMDLKLKTSDSVKFFITLEYPLDDRIYEINAEIKPEK